MKRRFVVSIVAGVSLVVILVAGLASFSAVYATAPRLKPEGITVLPYTPPANQLMQPAGRQINVIRLSLGPQNRSSAPIRAGTTLTATGWQKIMAEDFEGAFPATDWGVFDESLSDGGQYYWGKRDCKALSGSYSVWAGGGGSGGASVACTATYTNNLKTWLDYGPVDLSQVTDAEIQFAYWTDLEFDGTNLIDRFNWLASPDGVNYAGYESGSETGNWIPGAMGLSNIPGIGSLIGEPTVYLSWYFESSPSNPSAYEGAFVDDAALWVYTPPPPSPPPPTITLPVTRHTTLADFARGRSYDGTIVSQGQGDGALALAAQMNMLGEWSRIPGLPEELMGVGAVVAQNHLFILGGNGPNGFSNRVYSAAIGPDGLLDHWQATTSLPQSLVGHGVVAANGRLFVVGGSNAVGTQNTVFSAPIQPDGALGNWAALNSLPEARALAGVVAAHGYLYLLGGQYGFLSVSDQIYRARINGDGTIGNWLLLPEPLPTGLASMSGLEGFAALVLDNNMYILGGSDLLFAWDAVFRASIGQDGSLGSWVEITPLPKTLLHHGAVATHGGVLVAGGYSSNDGNCQKLAYWAALQPDGSLGDWITQPDFYFPMLDARLAASEDHAYLLGGRSLQNRTFSSVLIAPILTTTQVAVGNYNHQFELGDTYDISNLGWTESGADDSSIRVRYRLADAGSGYGPWSVYTSTNPIAINASGNYLEYQLNFTRGSGSIDRRVTEVHLEFAASNTAPTLAGLPDLEIVMNGRADEAIDLWNYAQDGEDSLSALTFTISNTLPVSAGITINANRFVAVNPASGWTGNAPVEVQVQDSGGLQDGDAFVVTVFARKVYLPTVIRE